MNEDESKSIAEILHELSTTSHIQVRSSTDLATQVTKAAADEDEERREGGARFVGAPASEPSRRHRDR